MTIIDRLCESPQRRPTGHWSQQTRHCHVIGISTEQWARAFYATAHFRIRYTALLEWVSEHAVQAYTTPDNAVSYLNVAQIAWTTPSFALWRTTITESCGTVQCLNCCRGVGRLNPQLFSEPPNTLSNYVLGGQLYTIHMIYTTILVGLRPSKSSTPQLIFHNSNTGTVPAECSLTTSLLNCKVS